MIAEAKEQNWNFTTEFTESTENGDRWAVIVLRGIERCGLLGESGGKITALHIGGVMKLAKTILIALTLAGAAGPAVGEQPTPLLPGKESAGAGGGAWRAQAERKSAGAALAEPRC